MRKRNEQGSTRTGCTKQTNRHAPRRKARNCSQCCAPDVVSRFRARQLARWQFDLEPFIMAAGTQEGGRLKRRSAARSRLEIVVRRRTAGRERLACFTPCALARALGASSDGWLQVAFEEDWKTGENGVCVTAGDQNSVMHSTASHRPLALRSGPRSGLSPWNNGSKTVACVCNAAGLRRLRQGCDSVTPFRKSETEPSWDKGWGREKLGTGNRCAPSLGHR